MGDKKGSVATRPRRPGAAAGAQDYAALVADLGTAASLTIGD